jgi:hypothetical protein
VSPDLEYSNESNSWARAQKHYGRPVAATLPECAALLKVPVGQLRPIAARVEPYRHLDGTPRWSLYLLERELCPERFGRSAGGAPTPPSRPGWGGERGMTAETREVPPDRLPCLRCDGRSHLAPGQIRGVCQGTYWDLTEVPEIERTCGQPIPDHDWWAGERRCTGCRRQAARLAELAQQQGAAG